MSTLIRQSYIISGHVQGVGFRPFVFRLAQSLGLTGFVRNTSEGVNLEVQGPPADMVAFAVALRTELPPLAEIIEMRVTDQDVALGEGGFSIAASEASSAQGVLISPDVAMCPDCMRDIHDAGNRHFNYPFTNCTNCGPRYTVTSRLPYDRPNTSLACFPMCPDCAAEYENPEDRRFHAQPVACPACGPQTELYDATGALLLKGEAALLEAAKALGRGRIVAIKGLGGFHLACDAGNQEAIIRLRERKNRPHKPLALMVPDLSTARAVAEVSKAESLLLTSPEAPIVLCAKKGKYTLPKNLAPDCEELGIMLPYTPLHYLLLAAFREIIPAPSVLVMTSGNPPHEPVCTGNREALQKLAGYADFFLLHNRDILTRIDDSVLRVLPQNAPKDNNDPGEYSIQMLRRARGYVPRAIRIPGADGSGVPLLAVGAELKNTLCLARGGEAFVSQHVGDLTCLENQAFFLEAKDHLCRLLDIEPRAVIHDLHPDYPSTRWAMESGLPQHGLQHHAAHIFAVAAEHGITGQVLGLALDGAGLGHDQTVWGGELLLIDNRPGAEIYDDNNNYCRLGHFSHMLLPGGDAAARAPWRMAQALLHSIDVCELLPAHCHWVRDESGQEAAGLVCQMLQQNVNTPKTSSCGRLFDAVAGLLGFSGEMSFEGQAAGWLEQLQSHAERGAYACPLVFGDELMQLNVQELFAQIWNDVQGRTHPGIIARRFHLGLINGLADLASQAAERHGINLVALSGGVMQNRTLSLLLPQMLRERGLTPLLHKDVPSNDGGVSLGQIAWARARGI